MRIPLLRIGYGLAIVVAVVYAFIALRGPHGVPAMLQKRQEIRELEEQNAALARENQLRRERIERLDKSAEEQEMAIRERLKLVKPNEKVYVLGK
ncbi:MAG: septum formation initiator family protein [Acidobacteria bacterium]|nr:septum formation initiator family protein [Acidobacteriota bacterium]MBI3471130.1 septum formation initiator family protein [Candidatus Solibacter usitatus]